MTRGSGDDEATAKIEGEQAKGKRGRRSAVKPNPERQDPPPDGWPAEVRRQLRRAAQLGIADEQLKRSLGPGRDYFKRFVELAREGPAVGDEVAKRILNERNAIALGGICSLFQSAQSSISRPEGKPDYEAAVVSELNSLMKGDRHTLFTIQPPLETDSPDVRMAVIEAASRGVKLTYYVPSKDAIGDGFRVLTRPDELTEKASAGKRLKQLKQRIETCARVFAWLSEVSEQIWVLMSKLRSDARGMDHADEAASFQKSLENNVTFWPMRWLWLSFNEKLVWISRRGEEQIRKEILALDVRARSETEAERWERVQYPMDCEILEALLRTSRAAEPLSWKEMQRG